MTENMHELAPHHLPIFIPAADGSDPLMTVMLISLIIGVILLGTFYLHLHSLPERLAHKHGRMQFELVAILGLLALFTHNNVFWVAALLLAFIQLPDFTTPLETMASSLGRIASRIVPDERADRQSEPDPDYAPPDEEPTGDEPEATEETGQTSGVSQQSGQKEG